MKQLITVALLSTALSFSMQVRSGDKELINAMLELAKSNQALAKTSIDKQTAEIASLKNSLAELKRINLDLSKRVVRAERKILHLRGIVELADGRVDSAVRSFTDKIGSTNLQTRAQGHAFQKELKQLRDLVKLKLYPLITQRFLDELEETKIMQRKLDLNPNNDPDEDKNNRLKGLRLIKTLGILATDDPVVAQKISKTKPYFED